MVRGLALILYDKGLSLLGWPGLHGFVGCEGDSVKNTKNTAKNAKNTIQTHTTPDTIGYLSLARSTNPIESNKREIARQ